MNNEAPDFISVVPTPPEGEGICDFCSSPDPQWDYPCRDFVQNEIIELPHQRFSIEAHSDGEWAACPACHALIERGDRVRLAKRSAKRLLKRVDPEIARVWSLKNATEHTRHIHDGFWRHREGQPERINQ